jgi:uncharacterized membrane protein
MENLVVSTFQDAASAAQGLKKLQELDLIGDIIIYNAVTIRKTGENQFDLLSQDGPDFEDRPALGALGGAAIGAIGGPIGMAIGMLTGTIIGSADADDAEAVSAAFLTNVNSSLDIDAFAILLDVEEDNEQIINSYMEPYHGVTVHSDIADQYDQLDNEQWKELNDEIDEEEKTLQAALDKDKEALKVKIRKLKAERDEKLGKIKSRAEARKRFIGQKIKALDEKLKAAGEKQREKINAQKDKVHAKLAAFEKKNQWAFSATY